MNDPQQAQQQAAHAFAARDYAGAERVLRELAAQFPQDRQIASRLALAVFNQGRWGDALPLLQSLIDAGDTDLGCVLAYAACLERTGAEEHALRILRRVLEALPTAESAVRLASALVRLGRHQELGAELPALRARFPDNAALLAVQSEFALASGDYATGYDLAAHRWAVSLEPSAAAALPCPDWDGRPFAGTLLITAEQGLGDEILVSSMFRDLVAQQQACLIACEPRLLPVFRRSFPTLQFVDRHSDALRLAAGPHTRRSTGFDLGRVFRRDRTAFPARPAWLRPDADRRDALRTQLQQRFPGRRLVGLSWRSHRVQMGDAKSIPLDDLLPVLQAPDCVFVNLQYGDPQPELDALQARTGVQVCSDHGIDTSTDIDGLLALCAALDAVVSCSNTTVHLAGAAGVPVHAMIPGSRYLLWYWGYAGTQTLWYPSVTLYRGPQRKPWRELAGDVRAALDAAGAVR